MKACPFCGGEANLHHLGQNIYAVYCSKCRAQTDTYSGRECAVRAWEGRTSERTGRWLPSPQPDCEHEDGNVWRCSVCGSEWQFEEGTPSDYHMSYCNNCGAAMSENSTARVWILHEESNTWECPNCAAQYELDSGNPETKGLNYCPVCGAKLVMPS